MSSKKSIRCLLAGLMVGTALFAFPAWAMDVPLPPPPPVTLKRLKPVQSNRAKPISDTQKAISLFSWAQFPYDIFHFIFLKYFSPIEWAEPSLVCRNWNSLLNHVDLWRQVGGDRAFVSPEEDKEALNRLKSLFQAPNSVFPKMFGIDFLPELTPLAGKAFKHYYISTYRKVVKINKEIAGAPIRGLHRKIDPHLNQAYEGGHPIAAHKKAKIDWQANQIQQGNLACLESALRGYPKTRSHLFHRMFNGFLKGLNAPSFPQATFQLLQPDQPMQVEQPIPSPQETFQIFIEWAHYWPQGRKSILTCLLPHVLDILIGYLPNAFDIFSSSEKHPTAHKVSDELLEELKKIGQGTAPFLSFTSTSMPSIGKVPFNKEWPEAFLLVAEEYDRRFKEVDFNPNPTPEIKKQREDDYTQAKTYFIKAFEKNANNSPVFLAKFLEPIPENLSYFKSLTTHPRALGTAYFKLCQIELQKIPPIAMDDHPTIGQFIEVLDTACDALSAQVRFLPVLMYRANNTKNNPNVRVKTLNDLIQGLDIKNKSFPIQRAFIEWALRRKLLQYLPSTSSHFLSEYIIKVFGTDFLNKGKLKENYIIQWTDRDNLFVN